MRFSKMLCLMSAVALSATALAQPSLQEIVNDSLLTGMRGSAALSGAAVVSDPASGRILALAHASRKDGTPALDTAESAFLREAHPLRSVTKPLVAALAIEKGLVTPDTVLDCADGKVQIDGVTFQDWGPLGKVTLTEAIAASSNVGSVLVAERIGGQALARGLRSLGFGQGSVATSYPGAGPGFVGESAKTERLLAALLSLGDNELRPTPLEVVAAYGAIANGGKLFVPVPADGMPMLARQVFSPSTSTQLRAILRHAVVAGTGKKAEVAAIPTAGKTGSGPSGESASFAGFAPATAPRLVVYVSYRHVSIEPAEGGGGHAAPVFAKIVEQALKADGSSTAGTLLR
jgi:cell division protein FtsI (penicillin-binding protein 3)